MRVAERGPDVDPDQVVVPIASRLSKPCDIEPLIDRLADRDVGLRVHLVVDRALELGQRDLGRGGRLRCFESVRARDQSRYN
jgi:hypothetical protein